MTAVPSRSSFESSGLWEGDDKVSRALHFAAVPTTHSSGSLSSMSCDDEWGSPASSVSSTFTDEDIESEIRPLPATNSFCLMMPQQQEEEDLEDQLQLLAGIVEASLSMQDRLSVSAAGPGGGRLPSSAVDATRMGNNAIGCKTQGVLTSPGTNSLAALHARSRQQRLYNWLDSAEEACGSSAHCNLWSPTSFDPCL